MKNRLEMASFQMEQDVQAWGYVDDLKTFFWMLVSELRSWWHILNDGVYAYVLSYNI